MTNFYIAGSGSGNGNNAAIPSLKEVVSFANKKVNCPLCDWILLNELEARVHIQEHYPRDSSQCPVTECGKLFTHPNSVRNHMRMKHSQQWDIMKQMK